MQLASAKIVPLSLATHSAEGASCRVFFSPDGDRLAVSVAQQLGAGASLRVGVAALQNGKWAGDVTVEPQGSLAAPLALVGFLDDSASVLIRGGGSKASASPATTAVASLVLNDAGKSKGELSERTVPGNPANQSPKFADAMHNRLWFQSYPQFCPLRSKTLTGKDELGPTVEADYSDGACDLPDAVVYPDAESIVMASTRSDRDWVWRVDLKTHAVDKLALPQRRFPKGQQVSDLSPLSPDGQVFGVLRRRFTYGLFDNFSAQGDEIAVVQVHPLRLLGIIRPKRDQRVLGVSVEQRDGVVTVAGYWDGAWQKEQLKTGWTP